MAKSPTERLATLQVSTPTKLVLEYVNDCDGVSAVEVEREAHNILSGKRLAGEWFNVEMSEAEEAVELALLRAHRQLAPESPAGYEKNGWHLVAERGEHVQYKHQTKKGRITQPRSLPWPPMLP